MLCIQLCAVRLLSSAHSGKSTGNALPPPHIPDYSVCLFLWLLMSFFQVISLTGNYLGKCVSHAFPFTRNAPWNRVGELLYYSSLSFQQSDCYLVNICQRGEKMPFGWSIWFFNAARLRPGVTRLLWDSQPSPGRSTLAWSTWVRWVHSKWVTHLGKAAQARLIG